MVQMKFKSRQSAGYGMRSSLRVLPPITLYQAFGSGPRFALRIKKRATLDENANSSAPFAVDE